jgi:hypothetical protein
LAEAVSRFSILSVAWSLEGFMFLLILLHPWIRMSVGTKWGANEEISLCKSSDGRLDPYVRHLL